MPKKKPSADPNDLYNRGVQLMRKIEASLRGGELDEDEEAVAEEAETALLDALEAAPDHGRALIMLGMLYRYTGRFEEAVDPLKAAMTLPRDCDDWTKAVDTLAAVYMNTDAHRKAVKLLEDAVKDHAGDPFLVVKLAACHDTLGKPAEAKRALEAGLKAAPGDATMSAALSEVNEKLGVAKAAEAQAALPPEAKALQDKAMKLGQDLQKTMEKILNGPGSGEEKAKKVAAAQADYQKAVMALYEP
ncbi:MAG: tetratricopeptide repeat protein [Planctomycetia bacterium]|nr:tetratricopeptide repeat protein [Planctomycetia bacterium]